MMDGRNDDVMHGFPSVKVTGITLTKTRNEDAGAWAFFEGHCEAEGITIREAGSGTIAAAMTAYAAYQPANEAGVIQADRDAAAAQVERGIEWGGYWPPPKAADIRAGDFDEAWFVEMFAAHRHHQPPEAGRNDLGLTPAAQADMDALCEQHDSQMDREAGRDLGLRTIARELVDQSDEPDPWSEDTIVARLHYWRDKAIRGSQAILALLAPTPDEASGLGREGA